MQKYLRLLRVPQWIKNFFVFIPLVFSKNLFNTGCLLQAVIAFASFCLVSSSVYIINDIADINEDIRHPVKKYRPVVAGQISLKKAFLIIGALLFLSCFSVSFLNNGFRLLVAAYFVINILYTFFLKHVVIIDLFCIASGFIIRMTSGAVVINVEISSWLILTTMFLSLFMAIMKRQAEFNWIGSEPSPDTRKVLKNYSPEFTRQMGTISAAGVIICYALYTVSERTARIFHNEMFVYTTVFVVFGIFRFMYLVYQKGRGENATEIMITDAGMIINIIMYILMSVVIIYF